MNSVPNETVYLTRRRGDAEKERRENQASQNLDRGGSGGTWAGAIGLPRGSRHAETSSRRPQTDVLTNTCRGQSAAVAGGGAEPHRSDGFRHSARGACRQGRHRGSRSRTTLRPGQSAGSCPAGESTCAERKAAGRRTGAVIEAAARWLGDRLHAWLARSVFESGGVPYGCR